MFGFIDPRHNCKYTGEEWHHKNKLKIKKKSNSLHRKSAKKSNTSVNVNWCVCMCVLLKASDWPHILPSHRWPVWRTPRVWFDAKHFCTSVKSTHFQMLLHLSFALLPLCFYILSYQTFNISIWLNSQTQMLFYATGSSSASINFFPTFYSVVYLMSKNKTGFIFSSL